MSERYVDLFGADGSQTPNKAALGAMEFLILGSFSPETVTDYCRVTARFLDWLDSLRVPIQNLDLLMTAGYLQNLRQNGHSVPTRVRAALIWAEGVFRVNLGCSGRDISDLVTQLASAKADGEPTDDPEKARMIPPPYVVLLGHLAIDGPLLSVRLFVGIAALCTHGIKRWAEAQCVKSLSLSRDYVVVTSWKSKRKRGSLTWADLLTGFSGRDWGGALLQTLEDAGLPGSDFMAFRPSMDLKSLTCIPADWADCCRAIQASLVIGGVSALDTVPFSTHSFKHLYPTMGRQLGLTDPHISTMGSWKSGDPMPGVYDSVACYASLVYKEHVRVNQVAGSELAETGNTPAVPRVKLLHPEALGVPLVRTGSLPALTDVTVQVPPVASVSEPLPLCPSSSPAVPAGGDEVLLGPVVLPSRRSRPVTGVAAFDEISAQFTIPLQLSQVLHRRTTVVHLFSDGIATVCSAWKCGPPDSYSKHALFAPSTRWTSSDSVGFVAQCVIIFGPWSVSRRCLWFLPNLWTLPVAPHRFLLPNLRHRKGNLLALASKPPFADLATCAMSCGAILICICAFLAVGPWWIDSLENDRSFRLAGYVVSVLPLFVSSGRSLGLR